MPQRRLHLFLFGWLLIALGAGLAYAVQAGSGVRVQALAGGQVYLPPPVAAAPRLPGVVIVPDGQVPLGALGWELARHGFVALVPGPGGDGLSQMRAMARARQRCCTWPRQRRTATGRCCC